VIELGLVSPCICTIAFNRWRKLSTFVYAKYPASCTDDLQNRKLEYSGSYAAFLPPDDLASDLNGYYFIKERHYGTLTVSRSTVSYFYWLSH
jgi:hypothetical protein